MALLTWFWVAALPCLLLIGHSLVTLALLTYRKRDLRCDSLANRFPLELSFRRVPWWRVTVWALLLLFYVWLTVDVTVMHVAFDHDQSTGVCSALLTVTLLLHVVTSVRMFVLGYRSGWLERGVVVLVACCSIVAAFVGLDSDVLEEFRTNRGPGRVKAGALVCLVVLNSAFVVVTLVQTRVERFVKHTINPWDCISNKRGYTSLKHNLLGRRQSSAGLVEPLLDGDEEALNPFFDDAASASATWGVGAPSGATFTDVPSANTNATSTNTNATSTNTNATSTNTTSTTHHRQQQHSTSHPTPRRTSNRQGDTMNVAGFQWSTESVSSMSDASSQHIVVDLAENGAQDPFLQGRWSPRSGGGSSGWGRFDFEEDDQSHTRQQGDFQQITTSPDASLRLDGVAPSKPCNDEAAAFQITDVFVMAFHDLPDPSEHCASPYMPKRHVTGYVVNVFVDPTLMSSGKTTTTPSAGGGLISNPNEWLTVRRFSDFVVFHRTVLPLLYQLRIDDLPKNQLGGFPASRWCCGRTSRSGRGEGLERWLQLLVDAIHDREDFLQNVSNLHSQHQVFEEHLRQLKYHVREFLSPTVFCVKPRWSERDLLPTQGNLPKRQVSPSALRLARESSDAPTSFSSEWMNERLIMDLLVSVAINSYASSQRALYVQPGAFLTDAVVPVVWWNTTPSGAVYACNEEEGAIFVKAFHGVNGGVNTIGPVEAAGITLGSRLVAVDQQQVSKVRDLQGLLNLIAPPPSYTSATSKSHILMFEKA